MSEATPILHMFAPQKHMSPFDVNMAADAGLVCTSSNKKRKTTVAPISGDRALPDPPAGLSIDEVKRLLRVYRQYRLRHVVKSRHGAAPRI